VWVHCQGLALADFGRDQHSSESGRARRNFVFFFLSCKQCTIVSERELTFPLLSPVRLLSSVCYLSVTLMHRTMTILK